MSRFTGALLALLGLASAAATAEPAAWRIESQRGGEIVLLGSVHTLRDSDYPLPAAIDALYEQADSIVMELDLDDLQPALIQTELLRAAMLPADTGLERVLDGSLYRAAEARASALGMDLVMLDRFEPWLVAITMLDLGMLELGYRPDRGVEQYLLGRARRDDKEVLGLETLATQVAVFDALPLEQQAALLEQTLSELDSADSVMDEMIEAWREGQLDELALTLLGDFEAFPGLYESLVVERNTAWIETLEDLLDDGRRYLIVVGGLHLVGDDSVVAMLAARGHDIERIRH